MVCSMCAASAPAYARLRAARRAASAATARAAVAPSPWSARRPSARARWCSACAARCAVMRVRWAARSVASRHIRGGRGDRRGCRGRAKQGCCPAARSAAMPAVPSRSCRVSNVNSTVPDPPRSANPDPAPSRASLKCARRAPTKSASGIGSDDTTPPTRPDSSMPWSRISPPTPSGFSGDIFPKTPRQQRNPRCAPPCPLMDRETDASNGQRRVVHSGRPSGRPWRSRRGIHRRT